MLVGWDTGAHLLPIVIRLGSTLPMLDSAVGHVFLGHLPKSATAPVVKAQQKQGATREMPASEVEELRREIRAAPVARTVNQMIFGLAALAAPVFGATVRSSWRSGWCCPARSPRGASSTGSVGRLRTAPTAPRATWASRAASGRAERDGERRPRAGRAVQAPAGSPSRTQRRIAARVDSTAFS